MKQLSKLMFFFCSIFILSNVAYATDKFTQEKPVVFIQKPDYEFQSVLEGTEVTHEFVIKNKGDALLKIDKVQTT